MRQPDDPSDDDGPERRREPRIYYVRGENGNGKSLRAIIDGAVILGIAGLVGVVWNLSNNVSALTVQVQYMQTELLRLIK